jgi:hypothetical protein
MATTIPSAFAGLLKNLELTTLQATTVSTRQQNVRDAVKNDFSVLDDFLVGSYRRSTMIAPLKTADVDVFLVLDSKHYVSNGQASLLDATRRALLKTYTRTPRVSRNGQAVTITFTDFEVDVVPGFHRKGGGYLIPDSVLNRWIETDPKQHVEIWATENKAHGGNLVPVVKMMKCWNRAHSLLLHSFHLETVTLGVLKGIGITDYPSGVRFVLDKAREAVKTTIADPAGYPGALGGYLNTKDKLDAVIARLDAALIQAREAERLASTGNVRGSIEKWRVVFGDNFPGYG